MFFNYKNINKVKTFSFFCHISILLGFVFLPLIVFAQTQTVEIKDLFSSTNLSNSWKFQTGDNITWANIDFDDSSWKETNILKSWYDSNLSDFSWYRKKVSLSTNTLNFQLTNFLAIQLGQIEYSSYQVFANGQEIGTFGTFPPNVKTSLPSPKVFKITPQNINADGTILLSIRLWKNPKYLKATTFYSLRYKDFQKEVCLGNFNTLNNIIEINRQKVFQADLIKLVVAILFFFNALHHLQLYYGRRELTEYFWFSIFSLCFAGNIFLNSAWATETIPVFSADILKICLRQVCVIPCLQFFWLFLSHPIRSWLRLIQIVQVIIVISVILFPEIILTQVNSWMFVSIILSMFAPLLLSIKEAWSGNPDARAILFGISALTVFEFLEVARSFSLIKIPLVAHWGMIILIISMAVALSNRFNRVYQDLDTLNQDLENKVTSRTLELATTNDELAKTVLQLQEAKAETEKKNQELDQKIIQLKEKNQQLIASQQQADRIFSALSEALPGTILDGKYRLDAKIGSGGYGAVFRATHLELDCPIAVKVFRPTDGNDSPEAIERFKLEGVSACRVNHPNAINVIDFGISTEGIAYIVMELLEGHTLKEELLLRSKLSLKRCVEIIKPVCDALSEAHSLGIVHRDIKPDNIFLHQSKQGEVIKVVDFGIAKLVGDQVEGKQEDLTESGVILGTPTYMAPERLKCQAYDGRSDVYSLGMVLYEMLTGKKPFDFSGKNIVNIVLKHIKESPIPLREYNLNIPENIEAIVMETLEKDPFFRPTAKEFSEKFTKAVNSMCEIDQNLPIQISQLKLKEDNNLPTQTVEQLGSEFEENEIEIT